VIRSGSTAARLTRHWGDGIEGATMGKNVETARGIYEDFAKGDVEAVLGAMDPNIDWAYPEGAMYRTQVGPQAVAENVFAAVVKEIPDFTVTVDEYVDGGDVVCTIGRYGGTGAETGQSLTNDFVHVMRFGADGKLVRWQEYTDTATLHQVFGR
jgi:ketosteroid isomerase-like protein